MKIDLLPKSKQFLAAPRDEVALHEASQALVAQEGYVHNSQTTELDNFDTATCALYHTLRQSHHAEFIRAVESMPTARLNGQNKIKFLIIPSLLYHEYPEIGGDGLLAQSIFSRNGFESELIKINSRGSVSENKAIIRETILKQQHRNIWLVSISKGTADLRACLQELSPDELTKNLKGWVNFSGIFCGSILADIRTNNIFKRSILRLICRLVGANYALTQELATQHPYWQKPLNFLQQVKLIHVVAFPLQSHVQPLLSHRFKKLSQFGPTDGMIKLRDVVDYPGSVYPLWGCDHFARDQRVSNLLYQLCHYIHGLENGEY